MVPVGIARHGEAGDSYGWVRTVQGASVASKLRCRIEDRAGRWRRARDWWAIRTSLAPSLVFHQSGCEIVLARLDRRRWEVNEVNENKYEKRNEPAHDS